MASRKTASPRLAVIGAGQLGTALIRGLTEAGAMVIESGAHPAVLKDEVTTPSGTTIDGILELEDGGPRVALIKAVVRATRRAGERAHELFGKE